MAKVQALRLQACCFGHGGLINTPEPEFTQAKNFFAQWRYCFPHFNTKNLQMRGAGIIILPQTLIPNVMKTKIQIKSLALIMFFVLALTNSQKAQNWVLDNQLSCDVKINFEEQVFGTPCSVCNWGTNITIPAGSSISIPMCGTDICISIQSVGGNTITWYNHANAGGGCHGTVQWVTGQSSTGECAGGWTGSWANTFTWTINQIEHNK